VARHPADSDVTHRAGDGAGGVTGLTGRMGTAMRYRQATGIGRWTVAALVGCSLTTAGCGLVPREDIRTFMTDLKPRPGTEPDEQTLATEIRARTEVEDFEFAESSGRPAPPVPGVATSFLRAMAGN
jgi:hypothetical protein